MSSFLNWKKHAVRQQHPATGCIPAGYEMLLRAAKVQEIDFSTFQHDFDLDRQNGPRRNDFKSVADAVHGKYPHVEFGYQVFPKSEGKQKFARVKELVRSNKLVLVSITNEPCGKAGWHIMPVVGATDTALILCDYVDNNGVPRERTISKNDIVRYHDEFKGGKDIAYLLKPQ